MFAFYRGQPELKEKIAICVGLIGGILGNEAGRLVDVTLFCITENVLSHVLAIFSVRQSTNLNELHRI